MVLKSRTTYCLPCGYLVHMLIRTLIFLLVNFAGLGLGGLFTGSGVTSDWYLSLDKAPWTPPGWVFGAAWTMIMVCFAIYMAVAWTKVDNRQLLLGLFIAEWILNVAWNPVFFYFNWVLLGLIVIAALTLLVAWFLFGYYGQLKAVALLVLPYFIWLCIATSLNAYILLKN